ncbi:major facilitator superfamily domain-containing protein [Chaetomium fimeti]|uniref:Major facilitator superfamily domain-containing protein n=1 Tax=Chaetomium fimeti TaxID=1854472 RepID=A0AAE0HPK5_9PEZI|nr:major facilitator superfamily domain-containing protein [Chaetomium fimeti]
MDQNLSDAAVQELEQLLDTKIYPGTEIMKDVGGYHFARAGSGHRSVLVPQPSADPHDPLNWSPLWKGLTLFSATVLTFAQTFGPLALAPMFGSYIQEWGRDLADVVQFTGVAILVLGFSNFIWVPIMVCFGRRPVAILSTLVCLGSAIWRARATSYDSFMGACILNGVGAGPSETLMPQVVADVVFLHDRGKYQTLYFGMYFLSLTVGPIVAGPMAENVGWRSFWWLYTGLVLFCLICSIFLFPETRYRRTPEPSSGNTVQTASPASGSETKIPDGDDSQTNEKNAPASSDAVSKGSAVEPEPAHLAATADGGNTTLGRGRPSRAQFLPFQRYEGSILREIWLPLYLHAYPVVDFAAFVVSWSASCYLVVNLSQTQAFAAPPYNYASGTIGLFNLALFGGGVIGLLTCGPLSDWVAARLTERNGGVREPEMRLVAMVPYVLVMVVGSVVTAVGYDNAWPWQAVVVVGYGALGMQVAAIPSIASTYAVDSYKPVTGSIFVMITINKNLWGYGIGRFLTPWAASSGFEPPLLMNMAMTVVFCACGIIFWFFGKRLRGLTAKSFVHKED